MNRPLKIAVLWRPGRNVEWQARYTMTSIPDDALEEASIHRDALMEAGYEAFLIRWDAERPEQIAADLRVRKADLVFNASSAQEISLLEACGVPFCGSGSDLVALDKATRKKILAYHGIPTAPFVVVESTGTPSRGIVALDDLPKWQPPAPMDYPLFVKPVRGRGSAGISDDSIVTHGEGLYVQAEAIISRLNQGALVENYVRGREVTVGVIGDPPSVLTPLEIEYNKARTNSFTHKKDNEIIHCPARLSPDVMTRVKDVALAAFEALSARDFGRIDSIVAPDGTPWVLEINTFAGLQALTGKEKHLHGSYIGNMATHMGLSRGELLGRIVASAKRRYGI